MKGLGKKEMEQFFYSLMSLPREEVEIVDITGNEGEAVIISIKGRMKKQCCPNCG